MNTGDLLQIFIYFSILLLLAVPLGTYMRKVYMGERHVLSRLHPVEKLLYRFSGIDETQQMTGKTYSLSVVIFSIAGFLLLFLMLMFQHFLPFNPQNLDGLSWHLAFNTAVSFVTNTNWQSYGGEATMSYFSQTVGLTVQNFISAAVGMAVLIALTRGFIQKNRAEIGNFWVDFTRGVLYILLPLSLVLAIVLASQGVVQSLSPYIETAVLDASQETATQVLPLGNAASQIAIKQLGTNGGGFFNVNSAHPFENPTAFSNFLQMISILLIPAALCFTFSSMLGDKKQGRALLITMFAVFIPLFFACYAFEMQGNTHLNDPSFRTASGCERDAESSGVSQDSASTASPSCGMMRSPNMEGKEVRFGVVNSALWASATTAASNGSVNAMHASFTPLGGLIPLVFIQLGEVIFGGVGSGLYGMIVFALITVFIAGLMVGRTPEYLGKKIQAFEIQMASVAILAPCLMILLGSSIAVLLDAGLAGLLNKGAAGFTEILYAFSSAANNNGSAFAGLTANSPFYNVALGLSMIVGRFAVLLPVLAIAGSLSAKNAVPVTSGTLPTHTPLFIVMLIGVILLVGFLTFVPALVLGPVIEHLTMIHS